MKTVELNAFIQYTVTINVPDDTDNGQLLTDINNGTLQLGDSIIESTCIYEDLTYTACDDVEFDPDAEDVSSILEA